MLDHLTRIIDSGLCSQISTESAELEIRFTLGKVKFSPAVCTNSMHAALQTPYGSVFDDQPLAEDQRLAFRLRAQPFTCSSSKKEVGSEQIAVTT